MENRNNIITKDSILKKMGITDMNEYNKNQTENPHECDNLPTPFDNLTLDELLFIREHNYFLD